MTSSTPPVPGSIDLRDRSRAFADLDRETFDVVVIGGGITGAGIARDAALRGLRVALVEARDIASGTSSRSSKMIHGGLRYLAQGDVGLVREAATERQVLRRIAPQLTRLSPFVMPGSRSMIAKVRAGLVAFERLGKVPRDERHRTLDATELLELEPTLATDRFPSGVVYPEFLTNDARLTVANVRSAVASGATVLTHAAATRITVGSNGRADGVEVAGTLPGEDLAARARTRLVVNAAGPWVDAVRALEAPDDPARLAADEGDPRRRPAPTPARPRHRHHARTQRQAASVFAVAAGPVTYLGTTDTFYTRPDEWPRIDASDVRVPPRRHGTDLRRAPDLSRRRRQPLVGVRPLIAPPEGSDAAPSELSGATRPGSDRPGWCRWPGEAHRLPNDGRAHRR